MFSNLKNFFLDTLFPVNCLYCGKINEWICDDCLRKIPSKIDQICPICEKKITPDGQVCFGCRRKSSLNGLLIATSYKNELISSAVHNYKYRFVDDLHVPLGKILTKAFLNSQLPLPDLIIPVPLHKRRLRYRGFNQAELLANYLGSNLTPGFPIPVINDLLIRQRYTSAQMKIKNYHQRKKNLENAFSTNRKYGRKVRRTLKGKRILIVDDIATTGATLFECARVLKSASAQEVFAIVIARQEIH